MKNILILGFIIISICGCRQSTAPDENPEWISKLIIKYESEPVGNPPQSIWRYEYKGMTVYYVPAQCCDQFSFLYDENGKLIGYPDGGFSGGGDGKLTDFFKERLNEKLVWKDIRNR